jgi:hypothetical protein
MRRSTHKKQKSLAATRFSFILMMGPFWRASVVSLKPLLGLGMP